MVQNKEEWSRLIGYGSGLEIVKFSLTKPEWAAPYLGFRGKWGDKEQLASLDHCSARWVLLVVCRTEKLLFSYVFIIKSHFFLFGITFHANLIK